MATPHLQPCAGALTGFVFICPGRFEASRGFPCAAGTGANLARALLRLHARLPGHFRAPNRSAYVITNSWDRVEYPALTGRSVPSEPEVLTDDNLARLGAELSGLSTIVACGAQAHAAVRALIGHGVIAADVAFARHLSQRSVNMIPGGSDTPARIERWCDGVLDQLSPAPGP